jgi:hypothetical protein
MMRAGPPIAKMLHGLGVLEDGVSGVSLLAQPVRVSKKNYAKTIGCHSASAPFPLKDKRMHEVPPNIGLVEAPTYSMCSFFQTIQGTTPLGTFA